MTLGQRIREVRRSKGIGLWTLSTRVYPALRKWTQGSHVAWKWETGRKNPTTPTLQRIADALGVTLSELLEGVTE